MYKLWSKNLLFLRRQKEETQIETAAALGLTRSTLSNYELGINLPPLVVVCKILGHFDISLNEMTEVDIENARKVLANDPGKIPNNARNDARKHARKTSSIDQNSIPGIDHAPDRTFLKENVGRVFELDVFKPTQTYWFDVLIRNYKVLMNEAFIALPGLGEGLHIRIPIDNNTMQPTIYPGCKVVATYQPEPATALNDGDVCLIISSKNKMLLHRVYKMEDDTLELRSDNEVYTPFKLNLNEIAAAFKVVEVHTSSFGNPGETNSDKKREIV